MEVTIGVKTLGGFGASLIVAGIWLGTLQNTVWAEQDASKVARKEQVQQGKDIASINERTKAILRAIERIEKNGKPQ